MNQNPIDLCMASTGKTRSELAAMIGISRQALYKWHRKAEIPLPRIKIVSQITGVPMSLLSNKLPRFSKDEQV